jgi:hypothetical protein
MGAAHPTRGEDATMNSYTQTVAELNGIKFYRVLNDYNRGYSVGFTLYAMTSDNIGLPEKHFKTKRQALAYAQKLSELTGLPIK